ncbi:MAG: hypothetical protein HKN02_08890 [Rhodobacteraceae bacterium]|nr:hypothetical protein [Paracoccaceae bacterium]
MFLRRFETPPDPAALARVEALVRERFGVAGEDIVLVTEEAWRVPGFPARMTTILFWQGRETRHRVRVFKPVSEIGPSDLPLGWLRGALLDEGEGDCC